ncbi:MAG TPA: anti-sigma factor [Nitrospiraceae bacterium]|nr:anti-sigma factor [Nitrospiraceae bacterium]
MAREQVKKFVNDYFAGGVACREFTEAITDYLEGHLSFRERIRFQIHLGLCLGCRRYLRQMKQTITLLGKLPEEPLPPAVREEILHRFRTWKSNS